MEKRRSLDKRVRNLCEDWGIMYLAEEDFGEDRIYMLESNFLMLDLEVNVKKGHYSFTIDTEDGEGQIKVIPTGKDLDKVFYNMVKELVSIPEYIEVREREGTGVAEGRL